MKVETRTDGDEEESDETSGGASSIALGCLIIVAGCAAGWLGFVWLIVKTGKWMGWL